MQFYYDSSGKLIKSIPEEVYQGSANANTIYFIGAFPENCVVAIAYIYPNGVVSEQQLLARVTDLSEIQTESGQTFNVWKCTIDAVVTEHYGTATIQFFVYDGRDTATQKEKAIATQACNFDILKGVPYIIPDDFATGSDLLTQILSVLPTVGEVSEYRDEAVNSAQSASESAKQAEQSATSALNSSNTALQAETNAKNSEEIAVASATQAQESALIAQESAQSATKSAEIAQEVSVKNTKDINNIYTLLGATVTDIYPLSQAYSTRQTADGNADIIDGALTRVTKIQGATVVGADGTLKNAYFKGIRSTGKNLFDKSTVTQGYALSTSTGGVYVEPSLSTSEFIPINGAVNLTLNWTKQYWFCCYDKSKRFIGEGTDVGTLLTTLQNTAFIRVSVSTSELDILQLEYGSTASEYEPYKADESFMLDNAVELAKWDYIDTENKKVVRKTRVITFNGNQTLTQTNANAETGLYDYKFIYGMTERLGQGYTAVVKSRPTDFDVKQSGGTTSLSIMVFNNVPYATAEEFNAHLAENPLKVAYQLYYPSEEALAIPTDKYQVWVGGSETVVQGDEDYSADGANNTVTQDYYTQKGA